MSTDPVTLLAIPGSLRRGSHNEQLLRALAERAPEGVAVEIDRTFGDLPLYDEDLDGEVPPAAVAALRERVAAADGLLIATPEYNGSVPGGLKNAVDWLSRPFGAAPLKGKPVAVLGTAMGQYGGVWAQRDLARILPVASARVVAVEGVAVAGSVQVFAERHPRDHAEVVAGLDAALASVVAAVREPVAA